MKKDTHILRAMAFFVGIGIFVYTIMKIGGFALVVNNLVQMGFYYVFVVLNSFGWMLLYTGAWFQMFRGLSEKINYFSLLRIKLCGEGVNFMTPLGFMGGDPVRLLLLRRYFSVQARLRSVVVDRVLQSLAAQYFNVLGLLLIFTLPISFPVWLHVLLLVVYVVLAGVLTVVFVSLVRGRGFGLFERVFTWVKLEKRLPKASQTFADLKDNLVYYRHRSKGPFVVAFFGHFFGRVLGAAEIAIAFYCFSGRVDIVFAVVVASLTSFFAVVFGFIPGALGVLETLYARFFELYGLPADMGVTIQLVRRLRVLLWMGIGLALMDYDMVGNYIKKMRKMPGVSGRK